MKILFISHSAVLQYHQKKLSVLAEKFGHEITLVTPPSWPEGGVDTPPYQENTSLKYITGKTVMFRKKFFHFYTDAEKIIKDVKPDIVHIEEEPFTAPCFQFIKHAKKPGIKTVFFTWENIRRGHNFIYSYWDKYCLKNADAAIAGNAEARDILVEKGCRAPVHVIPQYGVNTEDYPSKTINPEKGTYNAAYVGRVTPEKGIETLLEAVKGIPAISLQLAGAGDPDYIKKLREYAANAGMESRVNFTGHMKPAQMPGFLHKMDLLVLPSLTTAAWKEQFGRVIIEAFAANVPVIGSSSGEIPNVVGDAGLIFTEGNALDLASKIIELISSSDIYMNCVYKGYERVKGLYTNDVIAGKLDEIYKGLGSRG